VSSAVNPPVAIEPYRSRGFISPGFIAAALLFAFSALIAAYRQQEWEFPLVRALNVFARHSMLLDRAMHALTARDLLQGVPFIGLIWFLWFTSEDTAPRARLLVGTIAASLAGVLSRIIQLAGDDPELEELVSIAGACARRAEDAARQAREISWMARRRMSLVAAVTGTGVLAASAVAVIDRYQAFGEPGLPSASALVTAPFTTAPGVEPGSLGSASRPELASAPAASPFGSPTLAPTNLADRAPVPDTPRTIAEVLPPVGPAEPATTQVAVAGPAGPAPVPAAALSPPVSPTPVAVATAVSPPVGAARLAPVPVAAAVPPTAKMAERESPPLTVAEAPAPVPSPNPAPPSSGHASVGSPAAPSVVAAAVGPEPTLSGQSGVVSASLEASPVPAAPQAPHPVRHVRRVVRRVIYYLQGPGLLLAQVVYGVRRNLYEIFH
jgi:hypothetical protein